MEPQSSTKPELLNRQVSSISYLSEPSLLKSDFGNMHRTLAPFTYKDRYSCGTFSSLNSVNPNKRDHLKTLTMKRADLRLCKNGIKHSGKDMLAEKILSVWNKDSRSPVKRKNLHFESFHQRAACQVSFTGLTDAFLNTKALKKMETENPCYDEGGESTVSVENESPPYRPFELTKVNATSSQEPKGDKLGIFVEMLKQNEEHRKNKRDFFRMKEFLTVTSQLNRKWQQKFLSHKDAEKAGIDLLHKHKKQLNELDKMFSTELMTDEQCAKKPMERGEQQERYAKLEKREAFKEKRLRKELNSLTEIMLFNNSMIVLYCQSESELASGEERMEQFISRSTESVKMFVYEGLKRKAERILMDLRNLYNRTQFFKKNCREAIDLRSEILSELESEKAFILEELEQLQRKAKERGQEIEKLKGVEDFSARDENCQRQMIQKKRRSFNNHETQGDESKKERTEILKREKLENEKEFKLKDCNNASVNVENHKTAKLKRKLDEYRGFLDPQLKRFRCG